MSRFVYRAAAVPMRYPDQVQQESTLYALMGWPKKPSSAAEFTMELRKKQVASKAGDLYGMWQNRVAELGDAGWSVAANTSKGLRDRAGAQRCRPTFFIPKGATGFHANQARGRESFRTCNRTAVCPFCYARGVRDLWQRVDFALFHAPEALGRRETEAAVIQQQMEDSDVSGQSQELLLGTDHESENRGPSSHTKPGCGPGVVVGPAASGTGRREQQRVAATVIRPRSSRMAGDDEHESAVAAQQDHWRPAESLGRTVHAGWEAEVPADNSPADDRPARWCDR